MNFLVDYAGSSSSSDSEAEVEEIIEKHNEKNSEVPKLPKPEFGSLSKSVFSNPYAEEEQAKKTMLEKHVKMVEVQPPEKLLTINGKKICWMYRKGRCRFGPNCKFAHDTDLQKTPEELADEKKKQITVAYEGKGTQSQQLPPQIQLNDDINQCNDDFNWDEEGKRHKLKRPGLSQGIIPNKKILKMYKEQKNKEGIK